MIDLNVFFCCSILVIASDKSPFLRVLSDAEVAANAAAIQLVSFKDAMEDEFAVCTFILQIQYLRLS